MHGSGKFTRYHTKHLPVRSARAPLDAKLDISTNRMCISSLNLFHCPRFSVTYGFVVVFFGPSESMFYSHTYKHNFFIFTKVINVQSLMLHTHTHRHSHTQTDTDTRAHTHTHSRARAYTHTHTHKVGAGGGRGEEMLKRFTFSIVEWFLCSHLPFIINYCKSLRCPMPL